MTADIQPKDFVTTEFLALLLGQVQQVYSDYTEDWLSMHALDIAITAIAADENLDEESAKKILEHMSLIADWMLRGTSELSLNTRARLETIRDTNPDLAEPATTGVAS